MSSKEAARRRLQLRRARMSVSRDIEIVAEFERACWDAALILGAGFGFMFFVGLL